MNDFTSQLSEPISQILHYRWMNQSLCFYIVVEWIKVRNPTIVLSEFTCMDFTRDTKRTNLYDSTGDSSESISLIIQVLGVNHAFGLYNCLEWTICIDDTGNWSEPVLMMIQFGRMNQQRRFYTPLNEPMAKILQVHWVNHVKWFYKPFEWTICTWQCKPIEWTVGADNTTKKNEPCG